MVDNTHHVVFSHESYLSFYDIGQEKFIGHVDLETRILLITQIRKDDDYHYCVFLENGTMKCIDFDNLDEDGIPQNY